MDRKKKISPKSNDRFGKAAKSPRGLKRDAHGKYIGTKVQDYVAIDLIEKRTRGPRGSFVRKQIPEILDHVEPVAPVAPVDPVEPVDPIEPLDPVEPVDSDKLVEPIEPLDPLGDLSQESELPLNGAKNDVIDEDEDPDVPETFQVVDPLSFVAVSQTPPLQDIDNSSAAGEPMVVAIPQVANGRRSRNEQQNEPKASPSRGASGKRRSGRYSK